MNYLVTSHIETILSNTIDTLCKLRKSNLEMSPGPRDLSSRIIFPATRDNNTRVSEQELRFIFIEEFNKYCTKYKWDAYYSVETPTTNKYIFPKTADPFVVDDNCDEDCHTHGVSARFDLTIHNSLGERIAIVEFKANSSRLLSYKKDILKLNTESSKTCPGYFIQMFDNHNERTIKAFTNNLDQCNIDTKRVHAFWFALDNGESRPYTLDF